MHKIGLLVAAALIAAAGSFATTAQAKENPCKAHKAQADCTGDKACTWDAAKNSCKKAK